MKYWQDSWDACLLTIKRHRVSRPCFICPSLLLAVTGRFWEQSMSQTLHEVTTFKIVTGMHRTELPKKQRPNMRTMSENVKQWCSRATLDIVWHVWAFFTTICHGSLPLGCPTILPATTSNIALKQDIAAGKRKDTSQATAMKETRRTSQFLFQQGSAAPNVLQYKLEVHCSTNGTCIAVLFWEVSELQTHPNVHSPAWVGPQVQIWVCVFLYGWSLPRCEGANLSVFNLVMPTYSNAAVQNSGVFGARWRSSGGWGFWHSSEQRERDLKNDGCNSEKTLWAGCVLGHSGWVWNSSAFAWQNGSFSDFLDNVELPDSFARSVFRIFPIIVVGRMSTVQTWSSRTVATISIKMHAFWGQKGLFFNISPFVCAPASNPISDPQKESSCTSFSLGKNTPKSDPLKHLEGFTVSNCAIFGDKTFSWCDFPALQDFRGYPLQTGQSRLFAVVAGLPARTPPTHTLRHPPMLAHYLRLSTRLVVIEWHLMGTWMGQGKDQP